MKKLNLLIIIVLFAFAASASAQQNDSSGAPINVVQAFKTAHPQAKNVTWDKEGINYEANYKENEKAYSVVITTVGKILETEQEITTSELPSGVIKYISDNYKGYTLTGAARIEDNSGNVTYEAEINKGNTSKDVMFDQSGKPLKLKKETKENEEREDED